MNNFRKARNITGLTQEEVAGKLGVTRPAYIRYEQGERECSFATLCKLADIYGVSTDYLLGNEEAAPQKLDDGESNLLNLFRNLSEASKQALLMVATQMQPVAVR